MTRGELSGRVALVTGAGRGIGHAVACGLARAGAHVIATDVRDDGLQALARALEIEGASCEAHVLDVADARAVEALVEDVERRHRLSLLVSVAGVLELGSPLTLSDEAWERTFRVNTSGVFYVARSVARRMVARGAGSIVIVGSNAARVPRMQMAAYAASKAATSMLGKCLALELAGHGIRCNVVAPGSTDTPMQRALWADETARDRVIDGTLETFRTGIPLRRIASPDDIAEAVLFLLSDRARHITMHELVVDGGATLGA